MTLYVGNISYRMGEEELLKVFGQFGTVTSAKVIKDRDTGRSKGYGFVEMSSQEEAELAVENLNGKEVQGRSMKVNIAYPRAPKA